MTDNHAPAVPEPGAPAGTTASPPGGSAASPSARPHMSRRKHLVLDVSIIVGVAVVYVLSLVGYHWLASTPGPLPKPDVGTTEDTVVLVRFEQLHTVANRLDVKVLVMPDDSMIDKRLDVLTTDTSVRLYPTNDLGDLQYPVGKSPAQVATTIEAHGDPGNWPFDTYTTDTIQADVLVGPATLASTSRPRRSDRIAGGLGHQRPARRGRESDLGSAGQRDHHVEASQGAAGLRPGNLPRPRHAADAGPVRGHPDGHRPAKIPATVLHVVCGDAVRRGAAAQYPSRLAAGGVVDRPSRGDLGADSARHGHGGVRHRVVSGIGLARVGFRPVSTAVETAAAGARPSCFTGSTG
ncbi:putative conserved transmembrane protein [Mycobacterium kansasii]|uniref:Putative conserved transmembrane protein n=1 Tax=Mycobacterium kansasii TaxID=1768 RepID=A0A1V3XZI0_MYCKA|nr:putative conserved transmembrane protein [Mycobacterium kansasii]